MTLKPPTNPGRILITLEDGSEVLGYWGPKAGYREVGNNAIDLAHGDSPATYWCLELDRPDLDVIAWRPLMPEGDVHYEVETQGSLDCWGPWCSADTYPQAVRASDDANSRGKFKAIRVVEVIRRVVDPEYPPAGA